MLTMHVEGVRRNFGISSVFMYSVSLLDATEQRMLTIGVERHEAIPIVAALHHLTLPRPQAINVLADTMTHLGFTLAVIQIERVLPSPLFLFAVRLQWRDADGGERTEERTMTPGDAIGLAVLLECPIALVGEAEHYTVALAEGQTPELYWIGDFLKRQGIDPDGKRLRLGFSKTPMRDAFTKEVKAALLGKTPPFPEEDLEQRKRDYIALLVGDNP
jgi:bifunctional DNase/RNase